MLWLAGLILGLQGQAHAVSARWSYVEAYEYGGDWYMGYDNSEAILAWGESYVMMSVASMVRATGSPVWFDELAKRADAALAVRDDALGVSDYRGVSGACWQNTHYQTDSEPYCYVVHSGMIAYPIAEYARMVAALGLEDEVAYDGATFGEKADEYTVAVQEVVAYHDDQWDSAGTYIFRTDATFLAYAGVDIPFNQSNAMGRLLLSLYDLTGDSDYLDKATGLAERFQADLSTDEDDAYVWNYWGDDYYAYGEDISHAAINVDFAAMCAERGVVFDEEDMASFARTFMDNVYVDDVTFSDWVGGGSTNNSSYLPQVGRWLRLTQWRTGVYTAVRDLYETSYPPTSAWASPLTVWGLLAEFEPRHCEHFFYYVDWDDPDPHTEGDLRTATAYSGNILTVPYDWTEGCMMPLTVEMEQQMVVGQWDGVEYHRVSEWQPIVGDRFVPFEPAWPYDYWSGGALFQFKDAAYTGEGVGVYESTGLVEPTISETSVPVGGDVDEALEVTFEGEGDAPFWWSLTEFPTGARIDAETGVMTWTPDAGGDFSFTVQLDNDVGSAEVSFSYAVEGAGDSGLVDTGDGTGPEDTGSSDTDTDTDTEPDTDTDSQNDTGDDADGGSATEPAKESCGCAGTGVVRRPWMVLAWLGVLPWMMRRRRV